MSIYEKYELVDVLGDDGVKTFQARETATGRSVQIHMLVGQPGRSEPPFELLDQLKAIPAVQKPQVLESGEHLGTPYIVTIPLDGYASFREFVRIKSMPATEQNLKPSKEMLSRVGVWKVPNAPMETGEKKVLPPDVTPPAPKPPVTVRKPEPQTPLPPPRAESAPPDITQMFSTAEVILPKNLPSPYKPPMPSASVVFPAPSDPNANASPAAAPTNDEFEKLFLASKSTPPAPPKPKDPFSGEFTSMFQVPPVEPPEKKPPQTIPVASKSSITGEFEAMFAPPQPGAEDQSLIPTARTKVPDIAPPADAKAGEFTSMFQVPEPPVSGQMKAKAPETIPVENEKKSEPGSFTAMFQTPPASESKPQSSKVTSPGKTGQMPAAQPSVAPVEPKKPEPSPAPGGFTQMFQAPVMSTTGNMPAAPPPAPVTAPPPPKPEASPEPGSFTQMFQAPVASTTGKMPAGPPPPAPESKPIPKPEIPPPSGGFTELFQTGQTPAAEPDSAKPDSAKKEPPGGFTQMFQAPTPGTTGRMPVAQPPAASVEAKPAAAPEPGSFTQMFQAPTPGTTGKNPAAQPPAAAGPKPELAPPAPQKKDEPGGFTQMFQAPTPGTTGRMPAAPAPSPAEPATPAGAHPFGPPAAPSKPGEFTQMFAASPKQPMGEAALAPQAPPAQSPFPPAGPAPGQQAPGEFTRMFSSPITPKSALPRAESPQTPVAESNPFAPPTSPLSKPMLTPNPAAPSNPFGSGQPSAGFQTQSFGPPPGMGQPPAFGQPAHGTIPQRPFSAPSQPSVQDEYHKLFGGGASTPAPPSAPPSSPQGNFLGGATQSFQAMQPPGASQPAANAPSEYTRMFQPQAGAGNAAAAPATPQSPMATARGAAKSSAKWPIIAVAVLVLILLIGLVVTLVRK